MPEIVEGTPVRFVFQRPLNPALSSVMKEFVQRPCDMQHTATQQLLRYRLVAAIVDDIRARLDHLQQRLSLQVNMQ
jgi:hypothetical protein